MQKSGRRTVAGAVAALVVIVAAVVAAAGAAGTAAVVDTVAGAFRQGVPACSLAGSWSCCVIVRRVSTGLEDRSAGILHRWSEGCEMSEVLSRECWSSTQDQLVAGQDTVLEELGPFQGVAKARPFGGLPGGHGVRGPRRSLAWQGRG